MIKFRCTLTLLTVLIAASACNSENQALVDGVLNNNSAQTNTTTESNSGSGFEANAENTDSSSAEAVNQSNETSTEPTVTEPAVTEPVVTETVVSETADKMSPIYFNDFSTAADGNRIDQFVAYRDPFVVNHTEGSSDHSPTGGINCSAPDATRAQSRDNPYAHVYQCLPGGDPAKGHQMAYAMDSSGYGFTGALPDQVFEGLRQVSVDINTTTAGSRNFIEIKVIPADQVYVNAMPCIPDLPCNDGWDYTDIGGVGAGTVSQEGTGLTIATPDQPDGYAFDLYNAELLPNGDTLHAQCSGSDFCFHVATHEANTGIRERFTHIFRDNGDETLSFGIQQSNGNFTWVEAPGSFPQGPVRVVIAFHNYTGTKDGNGPGFNSNLSPSTGGFTWHWDNLSIDAEKATRSEDYFNGVSADRIITPDGCIAFAQGQRTSPNDKDISPRLHCAEDPGLDLL